MLAKEEGPGLWITRHQGAHGERSGPCGFQGPLAVDLANPRTLYGGALEGYGIAGVLRSEDGGQTVWPFGSTGMSIASLALSADGCWLIAGVYDLHGRDGGAYRVALDSLRLRAP